MALRNERAVAEELSVVVPTIGRPCLADCLDALAGGSTLPAEVIVVDQGTVDETHDAVQRARDRGLQVVHVRSSERGRAAARNRGLERVRTEYVAAVDDDCCAAPDWAERLVARLRSLPGAVITGRVEPVGDQEIPSTVVTATFEIYRRPLANRDPLFAGNMAAERSLFHRVGSFDEHPALLPAAEDNEWGYRALRAGIPIAYAPEVVVRHLDWRSDEELAETRRRYARGQGGFYGRYLRRADWFIARRALRDLAWGAWLVLRGLATRDRRLLAMGRAHTAELVAGIVAGLRSSSGPRRRSVSEPSIH